MTVPDRLQRVADELEIRNLLAELVWHADTTGMDDVDEYVACFTPDAEWEMRGVVRRGHSEIRAGAIERRTAGTQGPGSKLAHFVATTTIEFESDDRARARSYIQAYRDAHSDAPKLSVMGQYHDVFQRTSEGWKLHRRRVDFTWT